MSIVSDVLNLVNFDLLEDSGPVLGVYTLQQCIDLLGLTISDFCQKTCPKSLIQTATTQAGIAQYPILDSMMRVDYVFLGGVLLEPTTVQALNNGFRGWRTELGLPTRWHSDELPLQTIEVAAVPNLTGTYIPGPNEPDPPHAQTGSFNITDQSAAIETPSQSMGTTIIGPELPAQVAATTDPICFGTTAAPTYLLPQDFVLGYLGFGLEARMLSSDSELKDNARAEWAMSQYAEGVALLQAIMTEGDSALE